MFKNNQIKMNYNKNKKLDHSHTPLDHEQCRKNVYIVCWYKCSGTNGVLNETLYNKIKQNTQILNEIDQNDPRVPSGICDTCRLKLNNTNAKHDTPESHTFSG